MKINSVEWGVFIQKETVTTIITITFTFLFLFQEQAATPETSTTPAWSRLLMRMVPIWWETWLTSVDWWLLDWFPHHLTTVTLFPRQHTRRCVAAALASSSTGKVWMDDVSAKTNHLQFFLYHHYFCISTLISLAFCFLHCIFPLPFSRCAECGCQGQGDYVQLGVFDQSGCVSWAAGRTTQPCYCRYISSSPFKCPPRVISAVIRWCQTQSHWGLVFYRQVLLWLSNKPCHQSSKPTRRRFLLTAKLYPLLLLTMATRLSRVSTTEHLQGYLSAV